RGQGSAEVRRRRVLQPRRAERRHPDRRGPARHPELRAAGDGREGQDGVRVDQELRPPGLPAAHDRDGQGPRGRRVRARVPGEGHRVGAGDRLDPRLPRGGHGRGGEGQQEVAALVLKLNNVEVVYDRTILVLKGISLEVPEQRIVTLLGSNGAGKSTTLKAISGLLRPERGEITTGSVEFNGQRVDHYSPEAIVKLSVTQVMEGRR